MHYHGLNINVVKLRFLPNRDRGCAKMEQQQQHSNNRPCENMST